MTFGEGKILQRPEPFKENPDQEQPEDGEENVQADRPGKGQSDHGLPFPASCEVLREKETIPQSIPPSAGLNCQRLRYCIPRESTVASPLEISFLIDSTLPPEEIQNLNFKSVLTFFRSIQRGSGGRSGR